MKNRMKFALKNTLSLLLLLNTGNAIAQDFYDLSTVQTIEITFAQSNWDALLDAEKAGNGDYIMAQSVTINGTVMDSVGVKYKGNSSYQANQTKNPFHIELDTYKDHEYDGYTDIKLSNGYNDPSFVREVLSYQILRQYMAAPLSNYANVYVNGTLIGLYSNSESVSKKFVKSRFGTNDNTFVNCSPPDGAGPGSNVLPDLIYLGEDSTAYYEGYEMKSDAGWQELINLTNTLGNNPENIEEILDVDKALWMLAFDNALVNLDSYIGAFSQNYYLYRDNYGRFLPVVWDLNESFGRFADTGSGAPLNNTTSKQQMNHLLHSGEASFPLVQQLLNIPRYKRMYLAHYKTILLENFDNGSYYDSGLALQATINSSVQADVNKFYTYNNFVDNLTTDIQGGGGGGPGGGGPGNGAVNGITNLMNGRNDYLLGVADFTQTAPAITDIALSVENPVVFESVNVTAAISNANYAYLGHRNDEHAPFTKVEMYDDGAHNDGAANDGVYGTSFQINDVLTHYYMYADNDDAGMFSPQRAEYEYHTIIATTTTGQIGDLVINEFMASNDMTAIDPNGEYEDWIELYNNGASTIDLEGYSLSDDVTDLTQWSFPSGTTIAPGSYLIVWADDDTDQDGLHANFKLSASGETLFLVDPSGNVIDEITFTEQTADISYGRFPNGTGDFQLMTPTFNAENSTTTGVEQIEEESFTIYPNPAQGVFYIQTEAAGPEEIQIYSIDGKLVNHQSINQNGTLITVYTSDWTSGIYLVRLEFATSAITKRVMIE